jgi:hypothetical protein
VAFTTTLHIPHPSPHTHLCGVGAFGVAAVPAVEIKIIKMVPTSAGLGGCVARALTGAEIGGCNYRAGG